MSPTMNRLASSWGKRSLPCALAVLGLGSGAFLPAETPAAAALRAAVTPEVIAKWSPDVHFHWCEPYFPTSAEELFAGAQVFQVDKNEKMIGRPKPLMNVSALGALVGEDWRVQYDPNNKAVLGGELAPDRGLVTAPMYVSVMVPADASYVDIRYNFLFGFNGAQCMRNTSGMNFNYTLGTMAEHDGDWEGFTIRLGPDLRTFEYGLTEAHGDQHKFSRDHLDWTAGTHPQLRLALDSHGVYASRHPDGGKYNDNDWIILSDQKVNACVDIITKDGPTWQPWLLTRSQQPKPFRLIGRTADKRNLGEAWAQFPGRMGSAKTNKPFPVRGICGGLNVLETATANAQATLTSVVTVFKSELLSSSPCCGPGGRSEMLLELPAGKK